MRPVFRRHGLQRFPAQGLRSQFRRLPCRLRLRHPGAQGREDRLRIFRKHGFSRPAPRRTHRRLHRIGDKRGRDASFPQLRLHGGTGCQSLPRAARLEQRRLRRIRPLPQENRGRDTQPRKPHAQGHRHAVMVDERNPDVQLPRRAHFRQPPSGEHFGAGDIPSGRAHRNDERLTQPARRCRNDMRRGPDARKAGRCPW